MAQTVVDAAFGDTLPKTGDLTQHTGTEVTFHWVNGFDVDATFTLEGTYSGDADFSDSVELVSTTVSAGSTDRDALSEEWDMLRVSVDATSPASGNAVAYLHEERFDR